MNRILEKITEFYTDNGITEFLRKMVEINHPDDAIEELLKFLGDRFECERAYIFEIDNSKTTCSNTYEWCAQNIVAQKEMLQKEPLETVAPWLLMFEKNQCVVIRDLNDIKLDQPLLYASLKPQGINSLVVSAIRKDSELIGFIGVDNPSDSKIEAVAEFLLDVGYFISFVMDRRNMIAKLEYLSYHDKLTGALNRHAYGEVFSNGIEADCLGVLYCDISELKRINDHMGHEIGDDLILEWYKIIETTFTNYDIYRIGGDEFVVVCKNIKKDHFLLLYNALQEEITKNIHHMAIGSAWSNQKPIQLSELISKAEKAMYWDKNNYYKQLMPLRPKRAGHNEFPVDAKEARAYCSSELSSFFQKTHFDPALFFQSISMSDYFPFIGDLESNTFYISDAMKETFGFKSNRVINLMEIWEKRISDPEELELYRNDINMLLNREKDKHDLRYKVKDKNGNDLWVHSHCIIKWNEETGTPVFISGGVSSQEKNFVIDPVTNFPREYGAILKLREIHKKQNFITLIGFTLNNFSEINELRGRSDSDSILRAIATKLSQHFDSRISFYRLDGLKFVGILLPNCEGSIVQLVSEMREVISSIYFNNNIVVKYPCSIGVMVEALNSASVQDLLVNMTTLLSKAKHNPQEDFVMHSQKNIECQKRKAQMTMEISKNVLNGFENFRIAIQPTVRSGDLSTHSAEVLLRWKFEKEDISPAEFIPILESNRLILQVGKWVFEQAARTCKRASSYIPGYKLAVNVSYYQILDPEFLPFMEKILKRYELEGNKLVLEITETHYDETPTKVKEFVENCQKLGMEVAIDDFGDGYSSLAFLMKYPANIVKLDRSLIKEMKHSEDHVNFISSIIFACHSFKKIVCAEGVETKEEFDMICATQCDLIQGFYFYKPLELADFYALLPTLVQKD